MHRLLQNLRRAILSEYGAAFCLSLCLLFALTYQDWLAFDLNNSVDPKTYWGLAHFDFEQSVVRKYRVIIPFLVRALYELTALLTGHKGDMTMRICFYLVNMCSSAAWCTLAYAYLRAMQRSKAASLVAVMMIATSFWTIFNTAAFMTDSFYCCFVALTFLGIAKKNGRILFWAILIGPFAKEAYLFLLPVIFFYSGIRKPKLLLWFALSGIIVFGYRYIYDQLTGHGMMESLGPDLQHFTYIENLIHRFEDQNYTNPVIAVIGLWLFVPVGGMLLLKGFTRHFGRQLKGYMLLWLLLVFLQMVISGDLSRMLYLYLPIYAFMIAVAVDYWRDQSRDKAGDVPATAPHDPQEAICPEA